VVQTLGGSEEESPTKKPASESAGVTASVPARHPHFIKASEPVWREYGPITLPVIFLREPHTGLVSGDTDNVRVGAAIGSVNLTRLPDSFWL